MDTVEDPSKLLTAQGAKVLTKAALKLDLERKRNLGLTEDELQLLYLILAQVKENANLGQYKICVEVGRGKTVPPAEKNRAGRVAAKLEGLGYTTETKITPVDAFSTAYVLTIEISWEKE